MLNRDEFLKSYNKQFDDFSKTSFAVRQFRRLVQQGETRFDDVLFVWKYISFSQAACIEFVFKKWDEETREAFLNQIIPHKQVDDQHAAPFLAVWSCDTLPYSPTLWDYIGRYDFTKGNVWGLRRKILQDKRDEKWGNLEKIASFKGNNDLLYCLVGTPVFEKFLNSSTLVVQPQHYDETIKRLLGSDLPNDEKIKWGKEILKVYFDKKPSENSLKSMYLLLLEEPSLTLLKTLKDKYPLVCPNEQHLFMTKCRLGDVRVFQELSHVLLEPITIIHIVSFLCSKKTPLDKAFVKNFYSHLKNGGGLEHAGQIISEQLASPSFTQKGRDNGARKASMVYDVFKEHIGDTYKIHILNVFLERGDGKSLVAAIIRDLPWETLQNLKDDGLSQHDVFNRLLADYEKRHIKNALDGEIRQKLDWPTVPKRAM